MTLDVEAVRRLLADAVRPRLNAIARRRLEDTIEAEVACGDPDVADAMRFLLEKHDQAGAALAALAALEECAGKDPPAAMGQARLYTAADELVAVVAVPPFKAPPDVILWGARFFVRFDRPGETAYREAFAWRAATPQGRVVRRD